jgi:hypothetical protein
VSGFVPFGLTDRPASELESAEGLDKVHAFFPSRQGWERTLCGRRLWPATIIRPVGMHWFDADELARVDPSRPCRSCVKMAARL